MAGHDRTTAEGKKFFAQIEELKKLQVRVGYQDGQSVVPSDYENTNASVLDIAVWNEVGTENTPARPFMRRSADSNKASIEKMCKLQLQKLVQGETAQKVLNVIGEMQVGFIQDAILKSKSWAEPNAESTAKKKGSDVPLFDSGRMAQSVKYVITPKGGDD